MLQKTPVRLAWQLSLPVMLAYFPLGIVFGTIASHYFSWYIALIMSIVVYAGAVQFVAIGIIGSGGSWLTILVSCLFVALRNSFYGLSLLDRLNFKGWRQNYLIFGLVDTVFAILVATPRYSTQQLEQRFCLALNTFIYLSWVIGTLLGAAGSELLTLDLSNLEFVLVAFFVAMLVDKLIKSKNFHAILIALSAFLLMFLIAPEYLLVGAILICCLVYFLLFYWRKHHV